MGYSENWLRFRKAEDQYFTCRYHFMQDADAMVGDLKMALLSVDGRFTALRLLVEMKLEASMVLPLISGLMIAAVDSSHLHAIALAREVLSTYKDEPQVRNAIRNIAGSYLANDDEWHFRRIAELYELLDYEVEFTNLLSICRTSINPEIREISEDFDCMKKDL